MIVRLQMCVRTIVRGLVQLCTGFVVGCTGLWWGLYGIGSVICKGKMVVILDGLSVLCSSSASKQKP